MECDTFDTPSAIKQKVRGENDLYLAKEIWAVTFQVKSVHLLYNVVALIFTLYISLS